MHKYIVTSTYDLENGLNDPPKSTGTYSYVLHSWQPKTREDGFIIVWEIKSNKLFSIGPK